MFASVRGTFVIGKRSKSQYQSISTKCPGMLWKCSRRVVLFLCGQAPEINAYVMPISYLCKTRRFTFTFTRKIAKSAKTG